MTRGNLNNLLNFTVFIYNVGLKRIVGTGFIVSKDCKIVTCNHVLTMAKNYAEPKQVGVLIPWLGLTSDDCKYATVCAEFDDPSYDVVLLKLNESIVLKSQNIARIFVDLWASVRNSNVWVKMTEQDKSSLQNKSTEGLQVFDSVNPQL